MGEKKLLEAKAQECCSFEKQSSAPERSMRVVFDCRGNPWLCDAKAVIDIDGDLNAQGCWRFDDPGKFRPAGKAVKSEN